MDTASRIARHCRDRTLSHKRSTSTQYHTWSPARRLSLTKGWCRHRVIRNRCSSQTQPLSTARSRLANYPRNSDLNYSAAQSPNSGFAPPSSRVPYRRPTKLPKPCNPSLQLSKCQQSSEVLPPPAPGFLREKPRRLLGNVVRDNATDKIVPDGRGLCARSVEAWPKGLHPSSKRIPLHS